MRERLLDLLHDAGIVLGGLAVLFGVEHTFGAFCANLLAGSLACFAIWGLAR